MYEARWYDCMIRESDTEAPDFSKVPVERRQVVEEKWRERLLRNPAVPHQLWGPQIPLYLRDPTMQVTVL